MATDSFAENLLEAAGVRPSPVRILVVRTLHDAHTPLSGLDIEKILDTVDRSSITRTLTLLTEKELVHSIDDGSSSVKYELCRAPGHCSLSDRHVHFHCMKCGATFCLEKSRIPEIDLPDGFLPLATNYVIKGLCPACNKL